MNIQLKRFPRMLVVGLLLILPVVVVGRFVLSALSNTRSNSLPYIAQWFQRTDGRTALANGRTACPGAPFLLPSAGLIGLLWDDPASPYTVFAPHTGLDIFGDGAAGTVPVYAAYGGYLSRLEGWISSVIIRHDDPLYPGRTIWTYYTHMASRDGTLSFVAADFPAGTTDVWVEQGTLLGYQGEYAGAGAAPIGLHVHLSIVLSGDAGSFLNERVLANTLDPSPYFGMALRSSDAPTRPIACR